ncbi:hypothetical protein R1flu_001472 [Riccia fluitans]|uniref:Uncharacterized protein n=1 Tax=Riccia fluitans TaxID=41844 RepID=A0ABD1Y3E0_9MARC
METRVRLLAPVSRRTGRTRARREHKRTLLISLVRTHLSFDFAFWNKSAAELIGSISDGGVALFLARSCVVRRSNLYTI